MAPYSIPVRASGLATRPLINIQQPMHSLTRFQWVQQPRYIDPSWYPGEPATQQKQRVSPQSPAWRVYPKPANARVMPLTRGGVYPAKGGIQGK